MRRETLTVEFKSDRDRLPDDDLVEAVVCMANTDGGEVFIGIEDDGTVSGLHATHRNVGQLVAMIANKTLPPLSVRAEVVEMEGSLVARIEVPQSQRIVSTSRGVVKRRRLDSMGKPECVPFPPHEFASRQSDLGQLDYSVLPVAGASLEDLDPLAREQLRRLIGRYQGDAALLNLDDHGLDGALGITVRGEAGLRVPSVLGLLLIGREDALRRHLPTHEVAFQVVEGGQVRLNEFMRGPLTEVFERIMDWFSARNLEQELQAGMFRVPVPKVDPSSFREALANALTHRDYAALGTVFIRWGTDELRISNPGGLIEGVSLDNLLVVEPRPRNPGLADAFKRIGIVERTGRGVELIYRGLLRFGRALPDYNLSDRQGVVVELSTADADLGFLRLVIERENELGTLIPIDLLIALSLLWRERRIEVGQVAEAIQRDHLHARRVMERLVELGLVTAHGVKKGRTYTLSSAMYRSMGRPEAYVRQVGYDAIQQEEMVKRFVLENGKVQRRQVVELCHLSPQQASRLLKNLVVLEVLTKRGRGRGTYYVPGADLRSRA